MIQELLTKIDFISPMFYQILYMTVVGSIVGLIIYFIRNIFDNKISGKWKCIMWCIALVALLVPIRFEIKIDRVPKIQNEIIDRIEEIKYIGNSEYIITENIEKTTPIEINENSSIESENKKWVLSDNKDINPIALNNINSEKSSIPLKTIAINIIIPYIWLFGTAIFILIFLSGIGKINKRISRNIYKDERLENILKECKIQLNVKKKVKIILQKYKKVPSIFGIFNPSILITEKTLQENDETIKYIFLHELAHYKRKDIIFNFILLCVLSIHWFNPIVWFLFNKIRQDIEIGADELASKKLNKNEKKEYGMVLINLLRNKQEEAYTANMLCMSDTGKNMERRILMIKGKSKSIILSFLIVTVVVGVLAGLVFIKVTEKENINNDNLGLNSNTDSDVQTEKLTEEERVAVEEYVNKICNRSMNNRLPEFKDINDVDKEWIYSHLDCSNYYATAEEIKESLESIFGTVLIVNVEKDTNSSDDIVMPKYDNQERKYALPIFGMDNSTEYVISNIKKVNEQYIVEVVEYNILGDIMTDNPNLENPQEIISTYDENIEDSWKWREVFKIETTAEKSEIQKEILKRKEEFVLFNIKIILDKNNQLVVKEIEKNSDNIIKKTKEVISSNLSENEKKKVEDYINKICNVDPNVQISEFENINNADKYWIYSHLIPGTPAKDVTTFAYSTKEEIENCIQNLFGADLIVDLDKDMNENEDLLEVANHIMYNEERNIYEFLPYGWYTNAYYAIDSIEKKDNQYVIKVIEYFDMGGDVLAWYANTDNDYYKYSYVFTADAFEEDSVPKENSQIFRMDISNYETRQDIKKALDVEVLKRKNQFQEYNITIGEDKEGNICIKSIGRLD